MKKLRYWVIIPAAGTGQRMGGVVPKQYLRINGKTILEHTLAKFIYHPRIEKIVVAISPEDYFWQQFRLDSSDKIISVVGGEQRYHSVYAGLLALSQFVDPNDFILVHDAVRPCIHHLDINKLIESVDNHPIGGILGTKIRDTLKCTDEQNQIINTVPRENIWQALTPQMFRFRVLTQALEFVIRENHLVTDEAGAIEKLGFVPMVVEGRRDNIKITYPEDISLAEKYL